MRRYGHVHPPQLLFRNVLWLPHTFERMRIAEQMRRTLCGKDGGWLLERHTERYEDGIGSFQERFHRRTVVQVHNVLLDLSDLMYDAQRELAYTTKALFALSATRTPSSNQARCVQDMKLTLGRLLSCTHSTQSAHEEV